MAYYKVYCMESNYNGPNPAHTVGYVVYHANASYRMHSMLSR